MDFDTRTVNNGILNIPNEIAPNTMGFNYVPAFDQLQIGDTKDGSVFAITRPSIDYVFVINQPFNPNNDPNIAPVFVEFSYADGSGSVFTSRTGSVNLCQVSKGSLKLTPLGKSKDKLPTGIWATFVPPNNKTLEDQAKECGFTKFAWVQRITKQPGSPKSAFGEVQYPPFYEPPWGGWDYQAISPWYAINQQHFDIAYPFYYSPLDIAIYNPLNIMSGGCAAASYYPSCWIPIMSDAYTLNFYDSPHNDACETNIKDCIVLTTQLVGYCDTPKSSPSCDALGKSAPLFEWTWETNYNQDTKSGGINMMNYFLDNPGSGTGGVAITSINGVQLPPILLPSQISSKVCDLNHVKGTKIYHRTVTIRNVSKTPINGPLQILFFGMPANVTLLNATGNISGTPYLTVPNVVSLAPHHSVTVNVNFSNPSNATINFTPEIHSGGINLTPTNLPMPTNINQCQNDGWATFNFENQEQCIRYVKTGKFNFEQEGECDHK